MAITYTTDLAGIGPEDMDGFYVGWTSPPANGERMEILRRSTHAVIAMDRTKVVGFVNAISNGHMAYIPLLEVLPRYQGRGIGTEMVKRVIAEIGQQYGVDTACDDNVVPFYERLGFKRGNAMVLRNYGPTTCASTRPPKR